MLSRPRTSLAGAIALAALLVASTVGADAIGRCGARATVDWNVGADRILTVEGFTDGPDCAKAVVVIVIREPSGKTLWVDAGTAASIMTFSDVSATNVPAMTTSLEGWIRGAPSMRQTNALPDWPEGTTGPSTKLWSQNDKSGFPFVPEPDVDPIAYTDMREGKLPLLCYVVGMESLACIAVTPDGAITKVGVQSFPG